MSKVILHIGTHKTGTTSLQYYMSYNKEKLLEDGIFWPTTGMAKEHKYGGHHLLTKQNADKTRYLDKPLWAEIENEILQKKPKVTVLSSESFSLLDRGEIEILGGLRRNHDVTVVIYLRKFIPFIKAQYANSLKNKTETPSFLEFGLINKTLMDYNSLLGRWADVFGADNLIVHLYDKIKKEPGLFEDFASVIGVNRLYPLPDFLLKRNVTPNEKILSAIYLMHRVGRKLPSSIYNKNTFPRYRFSCLQKDRPNRLLKTIFMTMSKGTISSDADEQKLLDIVEAYERSILTSFIGEEGFSFLYDKNNTKTQ